MVERTQHINPYVAGNPVTGPQMFFGREDVFEFVSNALVGRHQDNVIVLHGERRTGKTSVLYQIHRHIDSRYIPVLIDLQAFSMEGTGTFLWEIASSIWRTLRRDRDIDVGRPRQEDFGAQPREFFQSVFLDRIWESIGDCQLLLMVDESVRLEDQILAERLDRDIFAYLRHLMQHHPRLNFIFSIGSRLEELQRDYAELFSVGVYKKVSFLPPDAVRDLITQPVSGIFEYADGAVDYIIEVGGRHAYYTQLICHSLFTLWERTRAERITADDVRAILLEVIERGEVNLKFIWDQASPVERLVLAAMVDAMGNRNHPISERDIQRALRKRQLPISLAEINSALAALVSREAITLGGSYKFSVDLLRVYVNERHRLEWVQEELSQALEVMGRDVPASVTTASPSIKFRAFALAGSALLLGVVLAGLIVPGSPISVASSSSSSTDETGAAADLATPVDTPPLAPTLATTQPSETVVRPTTNIAVSGLANGVATTPSASSQEVADTVVAPAPTLPRWSHSYHLEDPLNLQYNGLIV